MFVRACVFAKCLCVPLLVSVCVCVGVICLRWFFCQHRSFVRVRVSVFLCARALGAGCFFTYVFVCFAFLPLRFHVSASVFVPACLYPNIHPNQRTAINRWLMSKVSVLPKGWPLCLTWHRSLGCCCFFLCVVVLAGVV